MINSTVSQSRLSTTSGIEWYLTPALLLYGEITMHLDMFHVFAFHTSEAKVICENC